MELNEVLYVARATRRKAVLFSLKNNIKTPKNISKELKLTLSNVSVSLKELNQKELVNCKNPNDPFYKLYYITEKGKQILKEIETLEGTN